MPAPTISRARSYPVLWLRWPQPSSRSTVQPRHTYHYSSRPSRVPRPPWHTLNVRLRRLKVVYCGRRRGRRVAAVPAIQSS